MLQSIKISKCCHEDFKLLCGTGYFLSVLWTLSEPIFHLSLMWSEAKPTVPGWSINLNCTCWSLCISKWQWQWLQPGDFLSESRFQILTELHRISMSLEIQYMELWAGFLSRMTDKKTSPAVPWGAAVAGDPQGISVKAQAKRARYIQRTAKALHQGWRQPNAVAMLWSSLPVPLKTIFHWFLVSWALWRSYSAEFQWNLRGKGQKRSYETGPHIFDHTGDVPWLILRGNSFSKIIERRKLQDATETQGFGKVISSRHSGTVQYCKVLCLFQI